MRNLSRLVLMLTLAMPCMAQVQATFFDMLVNKPFGPDASRVTVPIASIRLLGRTTAWAQLCPASSNCDWQHLDKWLAAAKSMGISEVLYTNMKTPQWISANPDAFCFGTKAVARRKSYGLTSEKDGSCAPPRDVAPDGSGSDSAWKGFIQGLVDHNRRLDSGRYAKIKFWGIWNEPNTRLFWQGTDAQLVRMAKDAYTIIKAADPSALVLSPEPASTMKNLDTAGDWLDHYLAAGGGAYADVFGFHAGCNTRPGIGEHPAPECLVKIVSNIKEKLARYPEASGKPLWMTEGDWGTPSEESWKDLNEPAGFVVRYHTLLAWQGIQRVYWFTWELTMWTREDGELPAARAYKEMRNWLLGRTVSDCSTHAHVWSCDLRGPGYEGKIVWDEEYEKTASYDARGFTSDRDIFGSVTPVDPKAHAITVGNQPVLLETSSSRRQ